MTYNSYSEFLSSYNYCLNHGFKFATKMESGDERTKNYQYIPYRVNEELNFPYIYSMFSTRAKELRGEGSRRNLGENGDLLQNYVWYKAANGGISGNQYDQGSSATYATFTYEQRAYLGLGNVGNWTFVSTIDNWESAALSALRNKYGNNKNRVKADIGIVMPSDNGNVSIEGEYAGPFKIKYPNFDFNGNEYPLGNFAIKVEDSNGDVIEVIGNGTTDDSSNERFYTKNSNGSFSVIDTVTGLPESEQVFYIKGLPKGASRLSISYYLAISGKEVLRAPQNLIKVTFACKDCQAKKDYYCIGIVKPGNDSEENLEISANTEWFWYDTSSGTYKKLDETNQYDGFLLPFQHDQDPNCGRNDENIVVKNVFNGNISPWYIEQDYFRIDKSALERSFQDAIEIEVDDEIFEEQEVNFTVEESRPKIEIELLKKSIDTDETLEGADFDIYVYGNNDIDCDSNITDENGLLHAIITPGRNSNEVIVEITEREAPEGYQLIDGTLTLTYTYNESEEKWELTSYESDSDMYVVGTELDRKEVNGTKIDVNYITCYNKGEEANKLRIVKVNSKTGEAIEGVSFQFILDNARTRDYRQMFTGTTDSEGILETPWIVVVDKTRPSYITVREIGYPDDGKIYSGFNEVRFKIECNEDDYIITKESGDTGSVDLTYNSSSHTIIAEIENTVKEEQQDIDISGIVWLDGQTGIKPVSSPNGLRDSNEKTVKGVKVELCYRYIPLAEAQTDGEEKDEEEAKRTKETYSNHIQKQLYAIHVADEMVTGEDGTFSFNDIDIKDRENLWNNHAYQKPEDVYEEDQDPENERCHHTKINCVHPNHDEDCFDHDDDNCKGEWEYCDHICTINSGCYELICDEEAHTHSFANGCYTYNSTKGQYELTCQKQEHTHTINECYDEACVHNHDTDGDGYDDWCDDNHHDWRHSSYYYGGDVDCYVLNHDEHDCDDPDSYFPDDNGDTYPCYYCPENCTDTVAVEWSIRFTYDGVNFISVSANGYESPWESDIDSDAEENDRAGLNNKFRTITGDSGLTYNYEGNKAILETGYSREETNNYIAAGRPDSKFAIDAQTRWLTAKNMKQTKDSFGLGLVKKGVDLAAATTIQSAEVRINGEKIRYSYNDIRNLEDGKLLMPINGEQDKFYNLYLYSSDYNYRIGDYENLVNGLKPTKEDLLNKDYGTYTTKKQDDKELEVYVTYQITLNNQSSTNATINKIAYYYDTKYELEGANPTTALIDGKLYNKIIIDVNAGFGNNINQFKLARTFKVKKDANGNVYTGQMKNWVEIISYSTDTGCIDIDSAPDNITEHANEDDSDYQNGIQISLRNELERKISGYVFEDKDTGNINYLIGDGFYDASNEEKINGVIAQLIEIKEVDGKRLEYIWQETVTGSGVVKFITNDGKQISSYQTSSPATGQFEFKNFTAGNYIVRFIYGDKTYYDTGIDGNESSIFNKASILKYNGKDYKSTRDIYYNNLYYSDRYATNASMARDNEARRLEVMQNMVDIDVNAAKPIYPVKGIEGLEALWMCAESSIIRMPVAKPTDDTNREAEVVDGSASTISATKTVNLGLTKAPQTDLILEKHLTELKIDGVLQAITDFANCLYEKINFTYEQGENVFATATNKTKNQRGEWLIQTQIDNIIGKRMDVVYTYLVKNVGDKCYIGKALAQIIDQTAAPANGLYSNIAAIIKDKMKNVNNDYQIGTYVGTAYYTGDTSNDEEVAAVIKVEDYLNAANNLEMVEGEDFSKLTNPDGNKQTWQKKVLGLSKNNDGTVGTATDQNEEVYAIQSNEEIKLYAKQEKELKLHLYKESLDKNTEGNIQFLSYAAQLTQPDSMKGKASKLVKNAILGNLKYVQSYVPTRYFQLGDLLPESDETIAETITLTQNTGEDKETPVVLIASITGGIAIIAVGIVLIRKFIIKK